MSFLLDPIPYNPLDIISTVSLALDNQPPDPMRPPGPIFKPAPVTVPISHDDRIVLETYILITVLFRHMKSRNTTTSDILEKISGLCREYHLVPGVMIKLRELGDDLHSFIECVRVRYTLVTRQLRSMVKLPQHIVSFGKLRKGLYRDPIPLQRKLLIVCRLVFLQRYLLDKGRHVIEFDHLEGAYTDREPQSKKNMKRTTAETVDIWNGEKDDIWNLFQEYNDKLN